MRLCTHSDISSEIEEYSRNKLAGSQPMSIAVHMEPK